MDIRKFMKRSGDLLAVENKRQRSSSPLDTSRPSTSDADDEASLPRMPSQQYEKDESNSGVINDVAKFAKLRSSPSQGRNLSDEQRVTVLKNLWIPDPNTQFSVPQRFMKRGLKFQFNWLKQHPWLVYSAIDQGVFCKFCIAFAKEGGDRGIKLGQFVVTKFDNWKKATEVIFIMYNILTVGLKKYIKKS